MCEICHNDEGELFKLDLSQHGGQPDSMEIIELQNRAAGAARVQGDAAAMTQEEVEVSQAVQQAKLAHSSACMSLCTYIAWSLKEQGFRIHVHGPSPRSDSKKKSRSCLESLNHTFLICTGYIKHEFQEELVIEPRFREEFEIAHPTPSYQSLLNSLPAEFVGTRRKLRCLVEIVSLAAAEAFKVQGMALPPWRRKAATLSKWDLDLADIRHNESELLPIRTTKQFHHQQTQNVGFPDNVRVSIKLQSKGQDSLHVSPAKAKQAARSPGVSLLARGLADASAFQRMHTRRHWDAGPGNDRTKRQQSGDWDFSCLPPVNTVRRTNKSRQ